MASVASSRGPCIWGPCMPECLSPSSRPCPPPADTAVQRCQSREASITVKVRSLASLQSLHSVRLGVERRHALLKNGHSLVLASARQPLSAAQETLYGISGEPHMREEQGALDQASDLQGCPLVKICGVTTPEDATMAAAAGADLIGMILWPHAKRSVPLPLAAQIAAAAREGGAQSVGVFVDEDAKTIVAACEASQVNFAQLHGDNARHAWPHLPASLPVIYVLQADRAGVIQTSLPAVRNDGVGVSWILVDGLQGGSGEKLDWASLQVPAGISTHGWILAGGLSPTNVHEAVSILKPNAVDVSSGVTMPDKLRKDPAKVAAFIAGARGLAVGEKD